MIARGRRRARRDRRRRAARRARAEQDRRASTRCGRRRLANRFPGALQVSARTGEGLDELRARIAERFAERFEPVGCSCRTRTGAKLAELYELGAPIDEREDRADGVLRPRAAAARATLRRFAPLPRRRARTSRSARRRVIELPITRLRDGRRRCPTRAYAGDAGPRPRRLRARTSSARASGRVVGTGLAVAIPEGYAGLVLPRSGLAARHGITLVNAPGLIDSGYRGELRVMLLNTDRDETVRGRAGDADRAARRRCRCPSSSCVEVDELPASERGVRGFGSSASLMGAEPRIRVSALLRWQRPHPALPAREAGQGVLAAARRRRELGREPRRRAAPRARARRSASTTRSRSRGRSRSSTRSRPCAASPRSTSSTSSSRATSAAGRSRR